MLLIEEYFVNAYVLIAISLLPVYVMSYLATMRKNPLNQMVLFLVILVLIGVSCYQFVMGVKHLRLVTPVENTALHERNSIY